MSTSDRAYVWTWLPGRATPVPAGLVVDVGGRLVFRYGARYVARDDAISLGPDMPLGPNEIAPSESLDALGTLRDASPDAWGRQVIDFRRSGLLAGAADVGLAPELTYMLESGSNRFGALDFQGSSETYVARGTPATLEELFEAQQLLQEGAPVSESLERALGHGTTMGGARPKATLTDGNHEYIAKFSRQSDPYDVIGAERAAMFLAERAGIDVAVTDIAMVSGKKVLLVRRFDRGDDGTRRHVVSALTLSGLSTRTERYGTYGQLAARLRRDGVAPGRYGEELFRRVALNIAVSNTDDHLRNHAAFWDGSRLDLTPAYDISPMPRSGETATQAIGLGDDPGERASTFAALLACARHYGLEATAARGIVDHVIATAQESWRDAVDAAQLTRAEAQRMRERQILNPGSLHGW